MKPLTRSKIRGMLVGGAIGDALGAPVETWDLPRIIAVHGGPITGYVAPIGHKWFKLEEFFPGMTTDDTQLTMATMAGLINGHPAARAEGSFDRYMDAIAQAHIEAMKFAIGGWGKSTTEAVQRLADGAHWSHSGKTCEKNRGTGNGVPMKIAPLAAWAGSPGGGMKALRDDRFTLNQRLVDFSAMTHWSVLSAEASVIHANVIYFLLFDEPGESALAKRFVDLVAEVVWGWQNEEGQHSWSTALLEKSEHTLKERMRRLAHLWADGTLASMTINELKGEFGGGSCAVHDSLPFSYALFLRNPRSFGAILEAANAGGDNDTNAKLVGEMLGAWQGLDFFLTADNQWAVAGLQDYDKLLALADRFCDTFGIGV
jgi:ADP-ribosylglycohydrolase